MVDELKTKILNSLQLLDKLIYFIDDGGSDDRVVVLGFKTSFAKEDRAIPFHVVEEQAVNLFYSMDGIIAKAQQGLSFDEQSELFKKYNKLKKLLHGCDVEKEEMINIINSLDMKQLEMLNVQIIVYNIMRDLMNGKNLLKPPVSIKDYILYILEFNKPSGNYPHLEQ